MKKLKIVGLILLISLFSLSLFAQGRKRGKKVNLVGKNCPQLELEDYMLQGEKITQADFEGKVVFIEFFQNGCPNCLKVSLPHLEKVYKKYKDDPDCIVLAINTAFEKRKYPSMANEDLTKKLLKSRGWTFPVARDKDEKSVKKFKCTVPGLPIVSHGTPLAVIVGPDGKILAHTWSNTDKNVNKLTTAFEESLQTIKEGKDEKESDPTDSDNEEADSSEE